MAALISCLQSILGGCELLTLSLRGSWDCEVKGIRGVSYMTPHDFISEELP